MCASNRIHSTLLAEEGTLIRDARDEKKETNLPCEKNHKEKLWKVSFLPWISSL